MFFKNVVVFGMSPVTTLVIRLDRVGQKLGDNTKNESLSIYLFSLLKVLPMFTIM